MGSESTFGSAIRVGLFSALYPREAAAKTFLQSRDSEAECPVPVETVTLGPQGPRVCLAGTRPSPYLLGGQQQFHCLLILIVLKEEV